LPSSPPSSLPSLPPSLPPLVASVTAVVAAVVVALVAAVVVTFGVLAVAVGPTGRLLRRLVGECAGEGDDVLSVADGDDVVVAEPRVAAGEAVVVEAAVVDARGAGVEPAALVAVVVRRRPRQSTPK